MQNMSDDIDMVYQTLGLKLLGTDLDAYVCDCRALKISPASMLEYWLYSGKISFDLDMPVMLRTKLFWHLAKVINESLLFDTEACISVDYIEGQGLAFSAAKRGLRDYAPDDMTPISDFFSRTFDPENDPLPEDVYAPDIEHIRDFMRAHWWGDMD